MLPYSILEPLEELLAKGAKFLCTSWTAITLSATLQRSCRNRGLTTVNLMKERWLPLPEELQPVSVGREPHQASLCRLRLCGCHRLCISLQQPQLALRSIEWGNGSLPLGSGCKALGWGGCTAGPHVISDPLHRKETAKQ